MSGGSIHGDWGQEKFITLERWKRKKAERDRQRAASAASMVDDEQYGQRSASASSMIDDEQGRQRSASAGSMTRERSISPVEPSAYSDEIPPPLPPYPAGM
ncbi:unnamed protein product, partial [Meganyctiphanes norvegica]